MMRKIALILFLLATYTVSQAQDETVNGRLTLRNNRDNILTLQSTDNSWLYTNWLDKSGTRKAYMGLNEDLSQFRLHLENGTNAFNIIGGNVGINSLRLGTLLSFRASNSSRIRYAIDFESNGSLPFLGIKSSSASASNYSIAFPSNGRVGIGTTNPQELLQVGDKWTFHSGDSKIIGYNYRWRSGSQYIEDGPISLINFTSGGRIVFQYAPVGDAEKPATLSSWLSLQPNGSISMAGAKVPTGYKLAVNGKIIAKGVKVAIPGTDHWSDYVFEPTYQLKPLSEVEQYIIANKHLPDVPSAEEVVGQGIDMAEMDATLLQKIEELTLYTIEQEKKIESLESQLEKFKALEKRIEALEE